MYDEEYNEIVENNQEDLVYTEDLTTVLTDYDLEKGEIVEKTQTIHHDEVEGQEEISHYEILREYPSGGQDVEKIIEQEYIPHQDAYDEEKVYKVYVPYTHEQIVEKQEQIRLVELKNELASTDYEAIKYAEGWFTEEEYAPIKAHREELREQIRTIIDKPEPSSLGWDDEPDDPYVPNDNTTSVVKYDENNPPPLMEGPDVPTPEP